jgi:hypothetical protein
MKSILLWYLIVKLWLTNSSNPFNRLWSGPVILKYHTGSRLRLGFFLHPIRCGHRRKLTNDREESLMRLPEQSLEIVRGFHRCKHYLSIYFSLWSRRLKFFRTSMAHKHKKRLNFTVLKKDSSGDPVPLTEYDIYSSCIYKISDGMDHKWPIQEA